MRRIAILLAFVTISVGAMAQRQHERMKAARVGFITNKLELTPEQAEKFWPLYNQFNDKRENIQIERRMAAMQMNKNGITDDEAKSMIVKELETRKEELDLEEQFYNDVQKVITPSQTIKLIRAEREFNMEVLRNLQKRGGPGGPGGPDGPGNGGNGQGRQMPGN